MTKAPTPTEMSKGQSDNTNNATKKDRLNSDCGPTWDFGQTLEGSRRYPISEIQVMISGSNPSPLHYCCSVVIIFVWRKKILGKGVKGPWVLASCDFLAFFLSKHI